MTTKTTVRSYKVQVPVTRTVELTRTDLPNGISFAHPYFKGTAKQNRDSVRELGLSKPTSGQLVSVADQIYTNGDEINQKVVSDFKDFMRLNWFRGFTALHYDTNTGLLYFAHDPALIEFDTDGRIKTLSTSLLEKRLETGDKNILTVPLSDINPGEKKYNEIPRDKFMLGFAQGEEGAEALARIAEKHTSKLAYSFIPSFNKGDIVTNISALDSCYNGYRLGVVGGGSGLDGYGCVFGVLD